jgi:uncharacterized protein
MNKLQSKIQELKRRAAPISYSAVSVNEFGELQERVSLLDERIVEGYAIIWGSKNLHGEVFVKGCCAKSIRERGPGSNSNYQIKFLNQHNQDDPLSLFEELKEDDIGLYFRTKPLDTIESADRLLIQLRSGTINNFSHGWDYIWDKIEWSDELEAILIKEIDLFEISAVTIPSGLETFAIRSKDDIVTLHDDIEDFINILPRKNQLQARKLFALQKSLIPTEPFEQRNITLGKDKPTEKGIDYRSLTEHIKKTQII